MKLDKVFSVDSVAQPTNNYDPVPEGWYNAVINSAELKDTKAGTGKYLNIRYDITGETNAGRIVFGMITIQNPNVKAQEIGEQQFAELLRAIGLLKVIDTDELLGFSLSIKVGISQREGYDPRNEVKGFKALKGGMPPAPKTSSVPAKADGKAKAPWDATPF
jgi:hypothetical protein